MSFVDNYEALEVEANKYSLHPERLKRQTIRNIIWRIEQLAFVPDGGRPIPAAVQTAVSNAIADFEAWDDPAADGQDLIMVNARKQVSDALAAIVDAFP